MTDDPTTGLPPLPEGEFWRVIESPVPARYREGLLSLIPPSPTRWMVEHVRRERLQVTRPVPPKRWWSRSTYETVEIDGEVVVDSRRLVTAQGEDGVWRETLTPERVREAAEEIAGAAAAEAAQRALLGDYPPKRLED